MASMCSPSSSRAKLVPMLLKVILHDLRRGTRRLIDEARTCDGRCKYDDETEARADINKWGLECYTYKCNYCQFWHIRRGSMNRDEQRARKNLDGVNHDTYQKIHANLRLEATCPKCGERLYLKGSDTECRKCITPQLHT